MFIRYYCKFAVEQRKAVIWLVTLVTIGFALQLLNLKVNSSPYFMDQYHESRIHELDIKSLFSNSGEQILVVLKPDSGSPLDRPTVQAVKDLTEQFELLSLSHEIDDDQRDTFDPVKAQYLNFPIVKVRSLSTIENLTSQDDEVDLHPLLPEALSADQQVLGGKLLDEQAASELWHQFKGEAVTNPLFRGLLLSEDLKATSIQIEMSIPKDDNRNTGQLYEQVVAIVEGFDYEGDIYLAGNPVIDAEMARSMQQDNLVFFPFVMLIISTILYLSFKRVSGIYVPLGIAGITTIWTLGTMVALGIEQNIVTTILPVFILTVAVADAIHFYNHYLLSSVHSSSHIERLLEAFSQLMRPLVLTSVTTLIGFIALAWTDIIYIREFGLFMALGVVFAFLITVLLAPVLMPEINEPHSDKGKLAALLSTLVLGVLDHSKKVLTIIVLCLIASVYSLQYLHFDQENINNFDEDTILRSHNSAILQHYDGTIPIDIWIDTGEQGGVYQPEVVEGIKRIQDYLSEREDIGYVLSPVDFYERMYDLLTDEGHKLPEGYSSDLIAQLILFYENERSQNIKHVIDDTHRHARLIVLGKSDAASFWAPIMDDIKAMTPPNTKLEINGYGKVMHSNIEEVISTNISSTVIALSLIALVMIILFRSFTTGIIGILPLILTVTMNYAVMAWLGIAVDVGTTIIASIAFGIGIDYSIHYLSAIKREQQDPMVNIEEAIKRASNVVSMPVAINSLTLASGFLVLTVSTFKVIQFLGLFVSMAMILSALNALLFIPALSKLEQQR